MNTEKPFYINALFPRIRRNLGKLMAIALVASFSAGTSGVVRAEDSPAMSVEKITEYWHSGRTLPLEVGKQYPPQLINMKQDKGYNVLIDISHECSFATMWGLSGRLHGMGFRSVTNQASLDTVLEKGGKCRVRIPVDTKERIFPFAWYPNFTYNVVVTEQNSPDGQQYTPAEQKALKEFVEQGGALVIMGSPVKDAEKMAAWSLNKLAAQFGGELLPEADKGFATLKLGEGWEVMEKGEKGAPVQARRNFGKGKVVLMGSHSPFRHQGRDNKELNKAIDEKIDKLLDWACEGQQKVAGEPRFPQPMGGGGAIYPELEGGAGDIVVYYASNQKEKLLNAVTETYPKITDKIMHWLPSRKTNEPMYLILSAGDGGGWAVNAFKPKENGIISDSVEGLVSIYAHELAHTLGGPDNAQGEKAAESAFPNQGEAHAGWFQGKIDAWYNEERRGQPNRGCNKAFESDWFAKLDLKKYNTDKEYRKGFNNGQEWSKTWYIWQKLDDRYGPAWYPRWKWVQHTRWANDAKRRLTWEETVEDMSIACGEDLFPFFHAVGTSLDRENIGEIEFQGEKLSLKPTPLRATAPGPVRLDDIGDYKKPIVIKD